MRIVAFIPARAGSQRTPGKNIQPVLDVPLFLWAANNLNRCLPKEDIYIDSNSDEILSLAAKHGFGTIKRPEDLATNATNGNQFMLWEISNVKADVYIQHLPPMIFLKQSTLESAIDAVVNKGHDSAVGVVEKHMYLWKDGRPAYDLDNLPNSFTLEPTMHEGMGLYVVKADTINEKQTRFGDNPALIKLDNFEAIDIDYPEDLEFARTAANGLGYHTVYTEGINQYKLDKEKIKLLIIDVDGTMTDGGMYYTESGDEFKKFNTKDGIGIKRAIENGTPVAFLSAGKNKNLIQNRADLLGVHLVYAGYEPKLNIINDWCGHLNISKNEIAYIGDDINDISLTGEVGIFACPNDAIDKIRNQSTIVLSKKGGEGCVREFIDNYIL